MISDKEECSMSPPKFFEGKFTIVEIQLRGGGGGMPSSRLSELQAGNFIN